jgi:hypothetical protein
MEACATAHHWARELTALGHTAKLMPPAYVKDAGLTATLWRGHGRQPKSPQQHDQQAATWRTSSCSVKPALRPVFLQLRNASAGAVFVPLRGAVTDAASTRSTQDPDSAGFSQVPAAKWVSMQMAGGRTGQRHNRWPGSREVSRAELPGEHDRLGRPWRKLMRLALLAGTGHGGHIGRQRASVILEQGFDHRPVDQAGKLWPHISRSPRSRSISTACFS